MSQHDTTPFFGEHFETMRDAQQAQARFIKTAIEQGYAIRSAGIEIDTDYETKQQVFKAHARAMRTTMTVDSV
jgi:hypothetical protein